jgi:hypothetical protein
MSAPVDTVRAVVRETLVGLSTAVKGFVADHLAAALTMAQNAGRAAVFAATPPTLIRASEVNDRHRCGPCKAVHNTTYRTLAEAFEDYPGGGSYKACEGLWRCRGLLIAEWH